MREAIDRLWRQKRQPDSVRPESQPVAPERYRIGVRGAGRVAILSFAFEDAALIRILSSTSQAFPDNGAARVALNVGMFALITAENYALSRWVANMEQAQTAVEAFGAIDERRAEERRQATRGKRLGKTALYYANPLNIIKGVAGWAGQTVQQGGERLGQAGTQQLRRVGHAVAELGLVNAIGVPWATLEMVKHKGEVSRLDSLRMSALFAASWVGGAAAIQGSGDLPVIGEYVEGGFGKLGAAFEELTGVDHPAENPLSVPFVATLAVLAERDARLAERWAQASEVAAES